MYFYLMWCKIKRCEVMPITIHQFPNEVDVSNYRQLCNDKTHIVWSAMKCQNIQKMKNIIETTNGLIIHNQTNPKNKILQI